MLIKLKHVKETLILSIFLIAAFGIGISSTLLNNQARNPTAAHAASTFDQYCRNGVYYVKSPKDGSEIACGRAPNCGGTSYADTANIEWRNNGKCWVEDYFGGDRCKAYCAGYVPLCCYKMGETGDGEDCPFPERKYCRQDQCKQLTKNTDSNCGAGINTYCVQTDHCIADREDVPVLSLADRLAGKSSPGTAPTSNPTNTPQPTPTSAPQAATPTTRPANTSTPVPQGNNNGNNNSTPTNTPIPTATRFPTTTIQPNTSGGGGISINSNNNNSDFPTSIPTPTNVVSTTTDTKDSTALEFAVPHIALKSPKEMVKETVTEEKIVKLNDITDPPLKIAKTTFVSVKSYDQKLENTVRDWIEYLRVQIVNFIK